MRVQIQPFNTSDIQSGAWATLPRAQRRAHARWLHRTRPHDTSWPAQWATTQEETLIQRLTDNQ